MINSGKVKYVPYPSFLFPLFIWQRGVPIGGRPWAFRFLSFQPRAVQYCMSIHCARKPALVLLFALFPLVFSGPASAQLSAYGDLNTAAGNQGVIMPVPPAPSAQNAIQESELMNPDQGKWSSLFGGVHKKISKAAMATLNSPEFALRKGAIISGSSSESGHPSMSANGGDVASIWYGTSKAGIRGGVIKNYERFNSSTAYENIGVICHLTQDMAVPTHVANIPHGLFVHNDTFEGWNSDDEITVPAGADGALPPFGYYQPLQNETRLKLMKWVSPVTGEPYWLEPANRLPLGQDTTRGPKGHYGGAGGEDLFAKDKVTLSPEIHREQLAAAALATVNIVKAASRMLPPLAYDLKMKDGDTVKQGRIAPLSFGALDNNSSRVNCVINIYSGGVFVGEMSRGALGMVEPKSWRMPFFSNRVRTEWTGMADGKTLPPGEYTLEVTLTDEDGNVTPEEVNQDDITETDTRLKVTVE